MTRHREKERRRHFCAKHAGLPFFSVEKWYWASVVATFFVNLIVPAYMVHVCRDAFVKQGPLVMLQISDSLR